MGLVGMRRGRGGGDPGTGRTVGWYAGEKNGSDQALKLVIFTGNRATSCNTKTARLCVTASLGVLPTGGTETDYLLYL